MKKSIFFLFLVLVTISCASIKKVDMKKISIGMSKKEVIQTIGRPLRILSAKETTDGYFEEYQYRTYNGDMYMFEFQNGYLKQYIFMYEDGAGVPPVIYYPAVPASTP